MRTLESYLQELRECPDDQLTNKLGISDNWPIYTSLEPKEIQELLLENGKYTFDRSYDIGREEPTSVLNHDDGITIAQIMRCNKAYWPFNVPEEMQTHNSIVMIHPYQVETSKEDLSHIRAIANAVIYLGELAIENDIEVCMPKIFSKMEDEDPQKIVYHIL